jgi:hypothetical protein
MRVRDSGTDLVVDDRLTFVRWVGAFNFVIAGACAVIAWVHYQPGGELRDVFLILIVPFAIAIAGVGLWRALARPAVILRVDGARRVVTLVRRTAMGRVADSWPAEQVARFGRAQRAGPDGVLVYRLRLDLADGRSLPAAAQWQADPAAVDTLAARANTLLSK